MPRDSSPPSNTIPPDTGYWLLGDDGGVFSFGSAGFYGSMANGSLTAPAVCMVSTPDAKGYWLVGNDGGVMTFGDASFYGSRGGQDSYYPTVDLTPTRDGLGYWLLGSDGGIFTFGDAGFFGSLGNVAHNSPVVGMAPTPDGHGYWLLGSDGGIFTFGDAGFFGSLGGIVHSAPAIGMEAAPDGSGYRIATQDGGVFTFGSAGFSGSSAGQPVAAPIVAIAGTGRSAGCLGTSVPSSLPIPGPGGPPGEGRWTPDGRLSGSTTAVYTTVLRSYVGGPTAAIAWIDMARARLRLYAGPPSQPSGNYTYAGAVSPTDRPTLLAAFNSGFMMAASAGGWYSEGQMPVPLGTGAASLVITTDGRAHVGMWGRDYTLTPNIASVRQNLNLLVDGGQPASNLWFGAWGAVLSGDGPSGDWRSAVGIDRYGNLIYVGGSNLLPSDLAHFLITAGALEGMQLDINPEWVSFSTYSTAPGQSDPSVLTGWDLVPGMYFGPGRFISSTNRDFFAAFAK